MARASKRGYNNTDTFISILIPILMPIPLVRSDFSLNSSTEMDEVPTLVMSTISIRGGICSSLPNSSAVRYSTLLAVLATRLSSNPKRI